MIELRTRSLFYSDVTEEMEYLLLHAGDTIALKWKQAVERTIQDLLRHPEWAAYGPISTRRAFDPGEWRNFPAG